MIEQLWSAYAAVRGIRLPSASARQWTSPRLYDADFFRRHIVDDLIPFWQRHSLDTRYGGFITHLRRDGSAYADIKSTAMQARMVYAFATAYRFTRDPRHLQLAQYAVEFMRRYLWDARGGWIQTAHRDGSGLGFEKPVFHQSYAVIGLAHYVAMTGDTDVLQLARDSYDLAKTFLHDAARGGYFTSALRDWSIGSSDKTICSQLDMAFAALSLYRVTSEERYLKDTVDLAQLIIEHMRDPRFHCLVETCNSDWSYNPFATRDVVWIGHNLKGAWILLQLHEIAPQPQFLQAARDILTFCIRFGYDRVAGGFFHYVYRSGPLASQEKLWWTNCEAIMALLLAQRLDDSFEYIPYFSGTAEFCMRAFYDAEHGEWHRSCAPDGSVLNSNKGGGDKAAYHTVQACAYAYDYLQSAASPDNDAKSGSAC